MVSQTTGWRAPGKALEAKNSTCYKTVIVDGVAKIGWFALKNF